MQDERVIELLARALDEPLSPAEQAIVDRALDESIALRIAAEGLREFDSLLKRTGMAIPVEGFPARVLARIEAYERRRTRLEWLITLALLFLAWLAVVGWAAANLGALIDALLSALFASALALPVLLNASLTLFHSLSQGPLVVYALVVFALTWVWAHVGESTPGPTPTSG